MLKAVLFDLGDTLVHTHQENIRERNLALLKKHGYRPADEKAFSRLYQEARKENIVAHYSTTKVHQRRYFFEILLGKMGISPDTEKLVQLEKEDTESFLENIGLYPHAINVLEFCRRKKLLMAAISNGTTAGTKRMIEKLGIRRYFDIILISEELGHEKSSLMPFKHFLGKTGLQPQECLMVGNRPDEDMLAKRVGMKTVLVTAVKMPVVGDAEKADFSIKRIEQLIPIIEKLETKSGP